MNQLPEKENWCKSITNFTLKSPKTFKIADESTSEEDYQY